MIAEESFKRFMHPSELCSCCNLSLVVSHPSTRCTCCIVSWEKSAKALSLVDFITVKSTHTEKTNVKKLVVANVINKDINIIVDSGFVFTSDSDFFFGNEEVHTFSKEITFADILTKFELFPSKGQARKAGWDKPIPVGFSEFTISKLKHRLSIWNPSQDWSVE